MNSFVGADQMDLIQV